MKTDTKNLKPNNALTIDASVVLLQMSQELPLQAEALVLEAARRKQLYMSVLSVNQIHASLKSGAALKRFDAFLAYVKIVGFSLDVIENVTLLRQEHALRMVEAVVAATALVHQAKLMTQSQSDFTSVLGLTIINPDTWKVDACT